MARTRRTATPVRRSRSGARRKRGALPLPSFNVGLSPAVLRSLLGIVMLVFGAVLLIAIALPNRGVLTDWVRDLTVPFFGSARALLPLLLLVGGWYLEWGPGKEPTAPRARTLGGLALAYLGLLGAFGLLAFRGSQTGGHIGRFLAEVVPSLVTPPGAFVVFAAMIAIGLLLSFDLPLHTLTAPVVAAGRGAASFVGTRLGRPAPAEGRGRVPVPVPVAAGAANGRTGRAPRPSGADAPGQAGIWGAPEGETTIPSGIPSMSPTSATFAPAKGALAEPSTGTRDGRDAPSRRPDAAVPPPRDPDDVTDASDSPAKAGVEWHLPAHDLLDPGESPVLTGPEDAHHARNEEIIVKKLASFDIEARVIGRNAGPVVTQYEVQPAPHIKLSRIDALSDDLAMALAARSIRIEAPIPGKSAVGIEIPNKDFNIVALRRILDEVDFPASGSRLTFALGRDVAGRAQAVDLARMPHLLIAGATGSGKSVMVNALITSLLCNATPDEVRMILMDLKRVELAAYNGLPHLLVPVITEPERAKAALKWAVGEMEGRYRRFAGAAARNIKGFNETRVDPADRLPYIVIIIDELADLMMREGKNVEDAIVRLAQKARATGIHMVLATQRPSVNVVTGLIKANFPSRIAFAMASQIDSRTILDTPGAEDLIGRGDMLYQPSDLPRPMRLQGVFVSDPEIAQVTTHWREQIGEPRYDLRIIESDEEGTGSLENVADEDADRLLMDAVAVIREYDRASASLLQRRLKIGYARAARIVDQLEARGYVGAFDGSNARMVLRRDDTAASIDDEDEG
jgi:DNA segregation ATPase FtsK/SpoIIIE, S-DNA-T family